MQDSLLGLYYQPLTLVIPATARKRSGMEMCPESKFGVNILKFSYVSLIKKNLCIVAAFVFLAFIVTLLGFAIH